MKYCKSCDSYKEEIEFYLVPDTDRRKCYCKACAIKKSNEYAKKTGYKKKWDAREKLKKQQERTDKFNIDALRREHRQQFYEKVLAGVGQ